MGGVVDVVKLVLATGLVAQGVAESVIKAQLKKLVSEHQEEFELMNELYEFVEKISQGQNSLQSQLSVNWLFVKTNWISILETLEDKTQLLSNLAAGLPDTNSSNVNFFSTNGFAFRASMQAFAYIAYAYIAGRHQTSITSDSTNFKKFFSETSTTVRSSLPEIQGSTISQEGVIQRESFGNDASSVPQQRRQSQVSVAKDQAKTSTTKSKVDLGVNLVFIAVDIYKFVLGVINLIQLQKTLDENQKYFESDGEFEKAEQGMLYLMSLTTVDIFNMANSSRTGIFQSKNMLLVRSITLSRLNQKVLNYAKRLDAEGFGLTQAFFVDTISLINNCNNVVSSGKIIKEKLKDMKNYVKKFFDTHFPQKVFLTVASQISKVTGEYSLISDSIAEDQSNINRFLLRLYNNFIAERGQNFNQKPLSQKKLIDSTILNLSIQKYNQIFDLNLTLGNLNPANKDIIFQSITSFADSFYADDDTGKTLFGKNILQTKSHVTYKLLLDYTELNSANVIPVRSGVESEEKKLTQQWLIIAKDLNKAGNHTSWAESDAVDAVFRYLRLRVETQTKQSGGTFKVLSSFEGIRVKANQKYFQAERSVLRGTKTLNQV